MNQSCNQDCIQKAKTSQWVSHQIWEGWSHPWKMCHEIGTLEDKKVGLGSAVQERLGQEVLD